MMTSGRVMPLQIILLKTVLLKHIDVSTYNEDDNGIV